MLYVGPNIQGGTCLSIFLSAPIILGYGPPDFAPYYYFSTLSSKLVYLMDLFKEQGDTAIVDLVNHSRLCSTVDCVGKIYVRSL